LVLPLFSIGRLSPESRLRMARLPGFLGFGPPPYRPRLDIIPLAGVIESEPVEIREPDAADGNVTLTEPFVLASLVRRHRPATIFDIRTFDGRTTLNLAANASSATVHTLDLPPAQSAVLSLKRGDEQYIAKARSGSRFIGTEYETRIVQHYGDSARFDFSPFHGQVDFVFIDGAHSSDNVRNDSLMALTLLRNGKGGIGLSATGARLDEEGGRHGVGGVDTDVAGGTIRSGRTRVPHANEST
jgi:hypothetical protein